MPIRNGKIVKWKVRVKGIKKLLTDDTSIKEAQRVGKEIYKILTSDKYKKYFEDFEDTSVYELIELNDVVDCQDLNNLLDAVYDYCDANLIWID